MSESGAVQFEDYLGQLDPWPAFKLLDNAIDGRIPVCKVEHWRDFERCVREDDSNATAQMIYRGHRRHDWALAATLTRRFEDGAIPADVRDTLYRKFKLAMRGRGVDLAKLDDDREVWAYGQHFGLATPLLDWTESPFVALFFAFTEPDANEEIENPSRAVFRLNRSAIEEVMDDLFFEPAMGDNGRLVNQAGLFTVTPAGDDNLPSAIINALIEAGAVKPDDPKDLARYICKYQIPNSERAECLAMLRKMNIHHASLFPDPGGASSFCNDWLGRAIHDRRVLEEEKRRQAADAARPRMDVHEIADDSGADVELVKAFLEASLTDEDKRAVNVADWAAKVDAKYQETRAVDWPNRPNAVLKLRTEFRRLLAVLGWPEVSRDEIAAKLVDFYKERLGTQTTP